MSKPWLRLYSEMIHDRKIRRLKPEHRWLWTALLCMAGASELRGFVMVGNAAADVDDIADGAALAPKVVTAGLGELERMGLIERDENLGAWSVPQWNERQFVSDVSTERVKRFRNKQRNAEESPSESDTESEDHSSSVVSTLSHPQVVDDDELNERGNEVLESVATRRMNGKTYRNPRRYRATLLANLRTEVDRERLKHLMTTYPEAPADMLAGALEGEPSQYLRNYA